MDWPMSFSSNQRQERIVEELRAKGHATVPDLAGALEAARLGVELRLPLADSVILATAVRYRATLWTEDGHFEGLPGVKYFARPR